MSTSKLMTKTQTSHSFCDEILKQGVVVRLAFDFQKALDTIQSSHVEVDYEH